MTKITYLGAGSTGFAKRFISDVLTRPALAEATLTFLGGAKEVGKSCVRLDAGGRSMLLDCGMKLTEPPSYPGVTERADALVLSHTHLDHVG